MLKKIKKPEKSKDISKECSTRLLLHSEGPKPEDTSKEAAVERAVSAPEPTKPTKPVKTKKEKPATTKKVTEKEKQTPVTAEKKNPKGNRYERIEGYPPTALIRKLGKAKFSNSDIKTILQKYKVEPPKASLAVQAYRGRSGWEDNHKDLSRKQVKMFREML